ncbi:MAG: DUF917 family protein [Giesbergeria sp.]|nr:DUF917 family protein [Giesbergeria sp.]
MTLSICTAQLNFVVGDLPGNVQKIVAAAHEAHAAGAQLLLTPELALCGYAAEDLFLRPAFQAACDDAVKAVARETAGLKDLAIVLGHPQRTAPDAPAFSPCLNAASVLRNGRVEKTYAKRELPNYQVFDERRYFVPGQVPCVFEAGGMRVGLLICEDAWHAAPARDCALFGAELLVVINASPFHIGKSTEREQTMRDRVLETGLPLVYGDGWCRAYPELQMVTFTMHGVSATPILTEEGDTLDLGQEFLDVILGYTLQLLAFKVGGATWAATRPAVKAIILAAAEENAVLKANQQFRRWAGLDRRRDLRPARRSEPTALDQLTGVPA